MGEGLRILHGSVPTLPLGSRANTKNIFEKRCFLCYQCSAPRVGFEPTTNRLRFIHCYQWHGLYHLHISLI